MKTFIKSKAFYSILGFILIFIIWFLISKIIGEERLIFPGPIATIKEFFILLTKKSTYKSIISSLYKMFIGYLVSIILALILGTLAGLNKKIETILNPSIIMLKAIPTASLLFLFIVLAGFDNSPIYVVILVAFPILYEAFAGGIRNISKNIDDALKLDGGNNLQSIIHVKLPLASNYILVGIASSFGLAFKVEIMSEVLSGANIKGIGCSIKYAQIASTDMTYVFAWSFVAIIVLLLINLFSKILKKIILKKG